MSTYLSNVCTMGSVVIRHIVVTLPDFDYEVHEGLERDRQVLEAALFR